MEVSVSRMKADSLVESFPWLVGAIQEAGISVVPAIPSAEAIPGFSQRLQEMRVSGGCEAPKPAAAKKFC